MNRIHPPEQPVGISLEIRWWKRVFKFAVATQVNDMEHPPPRTQGAMGGLECRVQILNVFHDTMGKNQAVAVFNLIFFHLMGVISEQFIVQRRRIPAGNDVGRKPESRAVFNADKT